MSELTALTIAEARDKLKAMVSADKFLAGMADHRETKVIADPAGTVHSF